MKKIDPAIFKLTAMAFLFVLVSPFASSLPDGLEWCAAHLGFINKALAHTPQGLMDPPLKDYSLGLLSHTNLNTFLAGLIGLIIILGAFYLPRLFRKTH